MLSQLYIENVAIIDKMNVSFEEGLNVLTGETGAGKSIIIDSINMVLGERTSRDLIRSGEEKAVVEALFYIHSETISDMLGQLGIELEEDNALLISREITSGGKNVCRINGRIVTSSMLKDIGKYIVNIHGQHDNQALLQWDKHIDFLDRYGGSELLKVKADYQQVYEEVSNIKSEIRRISGDERERERKIDLLQFQLEEIEKAKLKRGEEEELTSQKLLLSNAEKLMNSVSNVYTILYTGNSKGNSVHDSIAEALKNLGEVERFDSKLSQYYKNLEEISYQLDELVHDIRDYRDNLEFDPAMLETIEQRLDLIFKLKRKYGSSVEEILDYQCRIRRELEEIFSSEERLVRLNSRLSESVKKLERLADELSYHRVNVARSLEQKIMKELHDLDMNKTQFKVKVEKLYDRSGNYEFSQQGYDRVEFLISTNPGEPLKPLVKIASGGEMSRIMLAIKTILADTDEVNTLVFDEIDIGVSGRAAQKIAEKLSLVAKKKQILCITHLPQIASMADHHYLIEKSVSGDKSATTVQKLTLQNRRKELARIIGGAVITDLTLKHAEEMINIARQIKSAQKLPT
ncbi:DNA repair protein RecN [Petroclostridium xylanilyticum]|uniref:DNA repair protein RecN n=1 Tax=Petroclostridium xylanilyticum TaxID=1792311 RepID=UPI000B99109F|nr:DNA repair protein RecN [Petroclostridium xylanilyticum]